MRAAPASPLSLLTAATTALPTPPPAGDELRDIKDIVPLPHAWPWWYWLAGGALLVLALFLFYVIRTRKKERPGPEKAAPDQIALQALAEAMDLARDGDAKRFAVLISDILRCYIEAHFGLRAPALTTREFLSSVAGGREQVADELADAREMLAAILHDCDLAKFAGAPLGKMEMEKIADQVAGFIRTTRPGGEKGS